MTYRCGPLWELSWAVVTESHNPHLHNDVMAPWQIFNFMPKLSTKQGQGLPHRNEDSIKYELQDSLQERF